MSVQIIFVIKFLFFLSPAADDFICFRQDIFAFIVSNSVQCRLVSSPHITSDFLSVNLHIFRFRFSDKVFHGFFRLLFIYHILLLHHHPSAQQRNTSDTGFFAEFAQCRLNFCFPGIAVSLAQSPVSLSVLQQKILDSSGKFPVQNYSGRTVFRFYFLCQKI